MNAATIPATHATPAAFKHDCQTLGLCQWRDPACHTCPNKTAPLTAPTQAVLNPLPTGEGRVRAAASGDSIESTDEAPTWTQVFKSWLPSRDACWGTALFVALFATYAWTQNADDAHATAELARAQQLGYHKGYNTGSAAALKAAHTACTRAVAEKTCDTVLENTVVAYADEVKP
jgi:hypothetical protein